MARSIDVRQPPQARGLAVYASPLASITPVLRFSTQLQQRQYEFDSYFGHSANIARFVRERRERLLPLFGKADAAAPILAQARCEWLDRKTSSAMITSMLGAFGAKPDPDVLAGHLDLLEGGDEIAVMLGMHGGEGNDAVARLWQPLQLSPVVLALACRALIASATFTPKPAELRAACMKAECHLKWGQEAAEKLVDYVRRVDAVLLEFDHNEWERPYLTPTFRPLLPRMLELHEIYGDGSATWDEDCDSDPPHPFQALVQAEQAKLASSEPLRQAACATPAAKRTRKPRRTPS